jgi:hypothetical protein
MVVQIDRQKERMATLMIFATYATHFLLPLLKNAEFVGAICRVQQPLVNASQQWWRDTHVMSRDKQRLRQMKDKRF